MPRTKTTATSTTTPKAPTLNDTFSYPYPTPSTSPALAPSPSLSPKKTILPPPPGLQHLTDSSLSLPVGGIAKLSLRSSGQSILSQLLAAHKPGRRDHDKLTNDDISLSQQTFRPKEQQRRSILPLAWTTFSSPKTTIAPTSTGFTQPRANTASSQQPTKFTETISPITSAVTTRSSRNVMENDSDEEDDIVPQSILPSVWLESVLHKLTRTERSTASHYATLPRVSWQDEDLQPYYRQGQTGVFPGLGLRSARERNLEDHRKYKNGKSKTNLAPPPSGRPGNSNNNNRSLSRRGSACELALGDDARDAFLKSKPRTLSSAELMSSITPVKESLPPRSAPSLSRNNNKSSLDQSTSVSRRAGPEEEEENEEEDENDDEEDYTNVSAPSEEPTTGTTSTARPSSVAATKTTTRGRFTIESASPVGTPPRTRTLSNSSGIMPAGIMSASTSGRATPPLPPLPLSHPGIQTQPTIAFSPASPTAATTVSNSLSNSSSMSTLRSTSTSCTPTVSLPPSPSLSPSPVQARRKYTVGPDLPSHALTDNTTRSQDPNDNGSNPISIPVRPSTHPAHQRTHSNSSIHSAASTSSTSRRSQVIIPPPASATLFQFASFSSISPNLGGNNNSSNGVVVGGDPGNSLALASTGSSLPPFGHPPHRPLSSSSASSTSARNNFRQLSIQIIEGENGAAAGRMSSEIEDEEDEIAVAQRDRHQDSPLFHLDSPSVHPLEKDRPRISNSCNSNGYHHHQTMNRVYPALDFAVDTYGGGSLMSPSSMGPRFSCSSVSSMSSVGSSSGPGYQSHLQHHQLPSYFRQRSLSATHLESSNQPAPSSSSSSSTCSSSLPPRRAPGSIHRGSWTDPSSRNPRGRTIPGVCVDPQCENENRRGVDSASSLRAMAPPLVRENSQNGISSMSTEVVDVKKSATGRMFTVERTVLAPASPTRCSRFIVVASSSTDDLGASALTVPSSSSSTSPLPPSPLSSST